MSKKNIFFRGMKDGIPIALGYFAVSIALGISAKNAGMTAGEASVASALIMASAGEYIGFTLIASGAGYIEVMLMEAVANARYLLMSTALSQKIDPKAGFLKRVLLGAVVTDELFGISIAYPGPLDPVYTYGAILVAIPGWTLGTLVGVILGNILPLRLVSALSVSLYGMFLAIFIPPAKKDRVIAALIPICFIASFIFTEVSWFDGISAGIKIILLTVAISLAAAILFPVKDEKTGNAAEAAEKEACNE